MSAEDAMARMEAGHARALSGKKNLGQQFIPITQLRSMKANDLALDQYTPEEGENLINHYGRHGTDVSVGQLPDHPHYQASTTPSTRNQDYDWQRLHEDVGREGIREPFHIGREGSSVQDRLLNGHHRAIVAMNQGHMFVPVTDNPNRGNGPVPGPSYDKNLSQYKAPSRTWEPLLQEHEAEHAQPSTPTPQTEGQQQLFPTPFNDRRSRVRS